MNNIMNFNDYQEQAMRTKGKHKRSEDAEINALLGLSGEVGEVCDIYKKHLFQGHDIDKGAIADELGDVLWYIALMCDSIGVSLSDVANRNIAKLISRYPDGFDYNKSVNRSE